MLPTVAVLDSQQVAKHKQGNGGGSEVNFKPQQEKLHVYYLRRLNRNTHIICALHLSLYIYIYIYVYAYIYIYIYIYAYICGWPMWPELQAPQARYCKNETPKLNLTSLREIRRTEENFKLWIDHALSGC